MKTPICNLCIVYKKSSELCGRNWKCLASTLFVAWGHSLKTMETQPTRGKTPFARNAIITNMRRIDLDQFALIVGLEERTIMLGLVECWFSRYFSPVAHARRWVTAIVLIETESRFVSIFVGILSRGKIPYIWINSCRSSWCLRYIPGFRLKTANKVPISWLFTVWSIILQYY